MSEDSNRPTGRRQVTAPFDNAFRGHRIHALPARGGGNARLGMHRRDSTQWIEAARAWMERERLQILFFAGRRLSRPKRRPSRQAVERMGMG